MYKSLLLLLLLLLLLIVGKASCNIYYEFI